MYNQTEQEKPLVVSMNGETKRVENVPPNKGNRLLGVRMSATGKFDDEFRFRISQSREIAAKLTRTRINRAEAFIIYVTRIKPIIHYPLSITTFKDRQCREIQSIYLNALLPKMGLNRKMDRRICFGPRSLGGMNIVKIEYDQFLKHLLCIRKHVTSNDPLGKIMINAFLAYQRVIGCDGIFFKRDPEDYVYRPVATQNSITYLWEKIWQYEVSRYPKC